MKSTEIIEERELIGALRGPKQDAERAFSEIYSRHARRVYAFILRMTGDSAVSQDLLQETFIKFFRASEHDLVVHSLGAFLLMIARNLCHNWRRDRRPTEALSDSFVAPNDASLERDDLLQLITLALELLEYEYREAFVLKFYQGYSYEEMSIITGETVPTLKNRVWRAKEKVRSALRHYITELQR